MKGALGLASLSGLGFAIAVSAAPVVGQALEAGTWTGTITGPEGDMVSVEYEVASGSDALEITLQPPLEAGDMPPMPFEDLVLDDDVLQFAWFPGERIECMLEKNDDGSFEGPYSDAAGDTGFMTMAPPSVD